MRAVVYDRYGPPDVLRVADVERPVPASGRRARQDPRLHRHEDGLWTPQRRVLRLAFFTGLHRPKRKILGLEFAGEVEAVGAAVTEFDVGDRVFGVWRGRACGVRLRARERCAGAHAGGHDVRGGGGGLRRCEPRPRLPAEGRRSADGRSVLVYGASGSVGTAGVQLAKHFGAHVTAVCDTKHVELVRSLGADKVIDYMHEDFTRNGETYDVIFDAVGKESFRRCRDSLKPGGTFVDTDPGFLWQIPVLALATRWIGDKRVALGITRYAKQDVVLIRELIEAGAYRAVIDRRYPLDEIVEAHSYVETGQKTGNVVLTVS